MPRKQNRCSSICSRYSRSRIIYFPFIHFIRQNFLSKNIKLFRKTEKLFAERKPVFYSIKILAFLLKTITEIQNTFHETRFNINYGLHEG